MSQIPANWSTFASMCDLPNGRKFIPNNKIVRGGAYYLKKTIMYRSALRGHGRQNNNYMPTGLRLVIKNDRNSQIGD